MALTKLNSASVIERLPVGSVLQTKISTIATAVNSQSADFDTGLSLNITPNSTSNKLYITFSGSIYAEGTAQWWNQIFADGSLVTSLEVQMYFGAGGSERRVVTGQFIYTPTSTNQVALKWRMRRGSGTINFGGSSQTSLVAQEIKQ